jgi:hypothetical protein
MGLSRILLSEPSYRDFVYLLNNASPLEEYPFAQRYQRYIAENFAQFTVVG